MLRLLFAPSVAFGRSSWADGGRRYYLPKIFLRHDVMRSVLRRFLDSKGVPPDAVAAVVATKHYYALHKTEFERFERVVVWWGSVGLHAGDEIGNVLRRRPTLLWVDIKFLESKAHWFRSVLRFKRHEIGPMLARYPDLLFHHAEDMGHFLQLLERLGMTRTQIHILLKSDPTVLKYCENVEELQLLVGWFRATLELKPEQCGKILQTVTEIMNPVYHRDLTLKYEYLCRMGISARQIGQIFLQNPRSLLDDVTGMKFLLLRIRRSCGLRQRTLATMLSKQPSLLTVDREKVDATVGFLRERVGLKDLSGFIQQHPEILLWDVPSALLPRWLFLTEVLGLSHASIAANPESLMHAVRVLMQRSDFWQQHRGKDASLPLPSLLSCSEQRFVSALDQSHQSYQKFQKRWRIPKDWNAALAKAMEANGADGRN